MRIWLVTRGGRPRALFSTAEGACEYVADNGGTSCCDIQCLVLDAWTRSTQFFLMPGGAAISSRR